MIPEMQFRVFCGEALAEFDTGSIVADWVRSRVDDDWRLFIVSGSPRWSNWESLAHLVNQMPDGVPAVLSFNSAGGDLHGLTKLNRAFRRAEQRGCLFVSYVESMAFGGSFLAAMSAGITWCHPKAQIGGLGGGSRAMSEALRALRLQFQIDPVVRGDIGPRVFERLQRGDTFHAELGECLGLNLCLSDLEGALVPWGSGFQRTSDD
jgi:hypothetical protein